MSLSGLCVAAPSDSCDITPPVLSAMSEATPVSIEPWVFSPSLRIPKSSSSIMERQGWGMDCVCHFQINYMVTHQACWSSSSAINYSNHNIGLNHEMSWKRARTSWNLKPILSGGPSSRPRRYHWNLLPCHPQLALVAAFTFWSNDSAQCLPQWNASCQNNSILSVKWKPWSSLKSKDIKHTRGLSLCSSVCVWGNRSEWVHIGILTESHMKLL